MKSSVQQYVSIFLIACLFVFFGVGIASDGFTDFDFLRPMPVAATAEVEDCSSEPAAQTNEAEPITWENERVEFEFTLVSGDISSDAGFSISDDGIFSLTNEEYYMGLVETGQYQSIYLRISGGWGSPAVPLEEVSDVKSVNLVREICKRNIRANKFYAHEADTPTWTIELYGDKASGSFGRLGDVTYSVSFNFLDRVSVKDSSLATPAVEDGYVFDGWYSDAAFAVENYIGEALPSTNDGKFFYYTDALPIARIEPAVTVTFVADGETASTLSCAAGTTLPTVSSLSAEKFMKKINVLPEDLFYISDNGFVFRKGFIRPFVINQDLTLTRGQDKIFVTVLFYTDDDLFYDCDVELNDNLNIEDVPTPSKPGYDFAGWQKVSDGSSFLGGMITEDTRVEAIFDLHYYTVTLNFPEGYATESGRTSFSETGVSHLTNQYYRFPYGDVFELKGEDGLLYKTDGWITEDGADYDFCSPIYSDLNLYAKVVRLRYKVSYWFKDNPSSYAFKIVEYYPGETVDWERDLAEYQKLGYEIVLLVEGAGASVGTYYEYDFSPVTSAIALYLRYSAYEYVVNFYRDSNEAFKSMTLTCEDKITLPFLAARPGYDFLGWFYKGGSPFDENAVVLSDLDLYAKWQIQRKTVTLVSGGEVQDTFEVDYGTSLNDVLKQINYKNYNVVSFSADGFTEENCFTDDVSFEVAQMDKQDGIVNTVKNKWQLIVGIVVGVLLLVCFLSVISKSTKKYGRKRK